MFSGDVPSLPKFEWERVDAAPPAEREALWREYENAVVEEAKKSSPAAVLRAVSDMLDVLVCENFTGSLTEDEAQQWSGVYKECEVSTLTRPRSQLLHNQLMRDGEVANRNLRLPLLLLVVLAILKSDHPHPAFLLWRARALFVHQRLMVNRAHSILEEVVKCYEKLDAVEPAEEEEPCLRIPAKHELYLCRGLVHHYYCEPQQSSIYLRKSYIMSGMKCHHTSMVGVRTYHQSFETAQLIVRARSATPDAIENAVRIVPKVIEGTNVLNRPRTLDENIEAGLVDRDKAIRYGGRLDKDVGEKQGEAKEGEEEDDDDRSEQSPGELPQELVEDSMLSPLEQAIVLGLCIDVRNNNPAHGLTEVERLPYIERLVEEQNQFWLLRSVTLLLRARMENKRVRMRERGLLQMCELTEQFSLPARDKNGTGDVVEHKKRHRCEHFWYVLWPSIFNLKHELGKLYQEIGMLKSGLEMHEELQDWADVIKCCKRLGMNNKAEDLIKRLLESDPEDPLLWSHLGDATRNVDYYLKAWELSNHKLAAPMRGLGELYLDIEKFEEAVECFDKALKLNPVFGANWFSMGWAAMKTKQWERAAYCYTRNVQLDFEDGFSWSNLATCNLQMNKKIPAFHSLKQAKKWMADDWRIWDNLFTVAVEVKEYRTAIQTLDELMVLKGRDYKVRPAVLADLVEGVLLIIHGKVTEKELEEETRKLDEAAEHQEEEEAHSDDDEFAGIVPLGHDVDFPDMFSVLGNIDHEAAERTKEAVRKAEALSQEKLRQRMHRTLGKVTTTHTSDPQLYCIYANFMASTGQLVESFDLRLKELRCVTPRNWQQATDTAMKAIDCATRVLNAAKEVPQEESEGEGKKVRTMAPTAQAKMQVQPVLKLAADSYGKTPEYQALVSLFESM